MPSSRLPGKPLADIYGKPMVVRVRSSGCRVQVPTESASQPTDGVARAVPRCRQVGGADARPIAKRHRPSRQVVAQTGLG